MNNKFVPDMYVKDILSINYELLKSKGIKVLLFDFDNTIIAHKVKELDSKYIELIKSLKKDFTIYILSNSINCKKLDRASKLFDIDYIGYSLKPLGFGYRRLNLDYKNNEVAMIGDQIMTDVWGAKRRGYFTILIDPINPNTEIIFTKINRKIEERILNKNSKLKRGDYYE